MYTSTLESPVKGLTDLCASKSSCRNPASSVTESCIHRSTTDKRRRSGNKPVSWQEERSQNGRHLLLVPGSRSHLWGCVELLSICPPTVTCPWQTALVLKPGTVTFTRSSPSKAKARPRVVTVRELRPQVVYQVRPRASIPCLTRGGHCWVHLVIRTWFSSSRVRWL
jgi:hypothetical protein